MSYRPENISDIIGQDRLKKCLSISIEAAKLQNKVLPHILFNGPPGVGKTTLALAIANEMGSKLQIANGANFRQAKYVLPYLTKIEENSILFIDEIHRMSPIVDEILYPVMEDFRLDILSDDEPISIPIPQFTLIGATTDSGMLSAPLRDRFVNKYSLCDYTDEDLAKIAKVYINKCNLNVVNDAEKKLVSYCRGTPRSVGNLVKWLKDYACVNNTSNIDCGVVEEAAKLIGIKEGGLTDQDNRYLNVLRRAKRPLGINTLVSMTGIDKTTITDQIEPFLLRNNLVTKTSKGRVLI